MLKVTTVLTGVPGAPYYSTDHYNGTTSGEAVQGVSASRQFWFQLEGFLNGAMSAQVQPEVQVIDPATGEITGEFNVPSGPVEFTAGGEPLPWATQGLISLRTATFVGGRRLRGRKFVPGWPETASTDGVPTGPCIAAMEGAYSFLAGVGAGAGGLCVYSPTHHTTGAVVSGTAAGQWSVLRSRRP